MNRTSTILAAGLAVVAATVLCLSCASPQVREGGDASPAVERSDRPAVHSSTRALGEAMSVLGVERNDERVLLMTNAGYARPDDHGTEFFADVATEVSGCSIGKRSLYFLHNPATAELWFALFRKDTGELCFSKWGGEAFEQQRLQADPAVLGEPAAFRAANSGPIKGSLFQVLSFSSAWAQGADPLLLKCAEFHNHCCGGVTAGYLAGRYIQANLPLNPGDEYVFVTASPSCAMDAIQVMFDATTGKKGMFSTKANPNDLAEYTTDEARPLTLVMRVNEQTDLCDGLLIGFAWDQTNQTTKLWNVAEVEKLNCVRVLKRFTGPASLARSAALTGLHPYDVVWNE